MTQISLDITMFVEGYREISEKKLAETNKYYVQLQTSFINDNGDLEQIQVKVNKKIDFKSLIGKVVIFKNAVEIVIGFDKFYKADDIEIITKNGFVGVDIIKNMFMEIIAVSDKTVKDKNTNKDMTNGFLFSKDIVDGAILTYKVKVKNTNRNKLAELVGKKLKLSNLSVFKPSEGFKIYYSIETIKDIQLIK